MSSSTNLNNVTRFKTSGYTTPEGVLILHGPPVKWSQELLDAQYPNREKNGLQVHPFDAWPVR